MASRDPITTHVLDVSRGIPAVGLAAGLYRRVGTVPHLLGQQTTDADGRILAGWIPACDYVSGQYEIRFDTASYFRRTAVQSFYPMVSISFDVDASQLHYHVPLLLSPFGYSTYRGS